MEKPSPFLERLPLKQRKFAELHSKRRTLENLKKFLGEDNYTHFFRVFQVRKLLRLIADGEINGSVYLRRLKTPEDFQQALVAIENLKQKAISHLTPDKLNEESVITFTILIREFIDLRNDVHSPFESKDFEKDIAYLYGLIYNEFKKSYPLPPNNPNIKYQTKKARLDVAAKRRLLSHMSEIIGRVNIKQFYENYDLRKYRTLFPQGSTILFICVLMVFILVLFLVAALIVKF